MQTETSTRTYFIVERKNEWGWHALHEWSDGCGFENDAAYEVKEFDSEQEAARYADNSCLGLVRVVEVQQTIIRKIGESFRAGP